MGPAPMNRSPARRWMRSGASRSPAPLSICRRTIPGPSTVLRTAGWRRPDRQYAPWYLESPIGIAAILRDASLRDAPQDEGNLLKHNNLMLRSERSERLEAWAASDSSF